LTQTEIERITEKIEKRGKEGQRRRQRISSCEQHQSRQSLPAGFQIRESVVKKKKGWMEILPRFKIQYPMKNRGKNTKSFHISYA